MQVGGHRSSGAATNTRFAQEWSHVLADASYLSWGRADAQRRLRPLVDPLAELLTAHQLDREAARELGARFAEARFRGTNALQVTLRLIRMRSGELFAVAAPDRVAELLGEFTAGYADGLRESIQREQESLLAAVLQTAKDTENAMRASEKLFRAVFTKAAAGIALVGLDGQFLDVNPAMRRLFDPDGVSETETPPRPITDYVHADDAPALIGELRELTTGRRDSLHGEARFVRLDHSVIWAHVTASLVRNEAEEPDYVIGIVEDVTERHQLRTRLRHQTYHDQLTRLPNRSLMEEQLRWAFSADSAVETVGLCHLDLDGFRAINDSLGHQIGDQLLLSVAARLQLLAGEHLVTRTSGDEFSVLVSDPRSVEELCELAEHILAGLTPPFVLGQHRLSATASLGIAVNAVTETWPEELQRAADAARSWAKRAGGCRWAVFDAERDAGETSQFALASSVPAAVDRGEFQLYYQPLVELGSGELIGVEALVRWRHPEYGLLGPAQFIDLAENNGSIVALGRWVLTEACRQARHWGDELGPAAPYVSVNVAPRQLAEPGWLDEVSRVLEQTGLDPCRLQLEITERAVLSDEASASDTLRTLRDMGVQLTIDDFGTGYSSLSYLRRLPVHGLKIDGSFIRGLGEAGTQQSKDSKIIEALITMAHALDLVVTAEWVETAGQARWLESLGCDVAQGNWYGAPVVPAQLNLRRPLAG